jgi:hypothetical protein
VARKLRRKLSREDELRQLVTIFSADWPHDKLQRSWIKDDERPILVNDDPCDFREWLTACLREHSMRVSFAADAAAGRAMVVKRAVDRILLVAEDIDRIARPKINADHYLGKPGDPHESLARAKNLLQRASSLPKKRRATARGWPWLPDTGRHQSSGDDGIAVMPSTRFAGSSRGRSSRGSYLGLISSLTLRAVAVPNPLN